MDEFLSDPKDGYLPWESEGISKTARDSFCDDENRDFLQWQKILSSFTKIDQVANVADLTQRYFFLCVQIFENRLLQNSDHKDPRTMMLVWDT